MRSNQNPALPQNGQPCHLPLLNEREAAARLGLSLKTLQIWRWRGTGPSFIKTGRAVRYSQSDLDAYIASCQRVSTSDPGTLQ